jgi:hypothetical protein
MAEKFDFFITYSAFSVFDPDRPEKTAHVRPVVTCAPFTGQSD